MSGPVTSDTIWSAAPILDAVENYRGSIIDLDAQRVISADELARARVALIGEFRRQGLASGDRVLVTIGNGPLFPAALAALLACEASPLLVHVMTPPAELARYSKRFGVKWIASFGGDPHVSTVLSRQQQLQPLDGWNLLWGAFADPTSVPGPELRGVPLHPTSGSTGLPKIALRPGFAAMEEARHYAETMAICEDDCLFAIPPMSHAYGYGLTVMTPLLSGASIVTTANFSMKKLADVLRDYPVTLLPMVPAHIDMLLFGGMIDFGRLRWLLTAGSMMPRRSAVQFRKKTGVTVCPLYGTTETGGISVATTADGQDVDGRVGPAMNGVKVCVRPPADAEDQGLEPGVGKLHIQSSSMMAGYLDEQDAILHPWDADGWFETGDLARIAGDAVIHLRGRTGEMINVLGLKVVPCEVEETIAAMPGVREVKVYGSRLASQAEIVKAAIAVEPGVDELAIRAYCEEHLVYYKRPQAIALVDALPRSPAGKIVRDRLP
ncbi:class I adenylate-forming enzyme family protein [Blastopirellula marina]|uniref:AMP-dependent synthetase and ligase n=1 Tax=Blastopirellula marina DSM 3645 TaxID=314230 RepID=A3ZWB6_9BACT|nr:class I adenylate-forming enzyme family protein [Blastopirellula marina]EAQ79144.1 AMP-dependent synthetase and ligase [Blastopirellula marina DSM 3645]